MARHKKGGHKKIVAHCIEWKKKEEGARTKESVGGAGAGGAMVSVVEIAAAVTNADRVLMAAVGPRRSELIPPQPNGGIRIGFMHSKKI